MIRAARPAAALSAHSSLLASAYPKAKGLVGAMVRWRPYICPLQEVIAEIPIGASVLDIGCGTGVACVMAAHLRHAPIAIGVDSSVRAIAVAEQAVMPRHTTASFRVVAGSDPWPADSVSTAMCIDVLHHVARSEQQAFVARLAALNFTDRLILKDISPHDWKVFGSHLHDLVVARERIAPRCEHEVARWLEQAGLVVEGPRRLDMLWYGHYLIVARRRVTRSEQ